MTKKKFHVEQDPYVQREKEKYDSPIPSREFIITVLSSSPKPEPIRYRQLCQKFQIKDPDLAEALRRRLKAMVRDGQLIKINKGFIPVTSFETVIGTLHIQKEREGYVLTDSGQHIEISPPNFRGYYNGDEVEVKVNHVNDKVSIGKISELIKAVSPRVIAKFYKDQGLYWAISLDKRFARNITIPKNKKKKAKDGDIVLIKISRDPKHQYHVDPVGEVVEVLGDFATPGIEIKMSEKKFGLQDNWPQQVSDEVKQIPQTITPQSKRGRADLTELPLITIDGEDAKDFDDAVYCQARPKGGWQLYVAIADVSYYVKPNKNIDNEAIKRGNSTYFPGKVIPMLPEKLSNGLCSLKPKVDRLCMVCQMSIDAQGKVTRSQFYRAVMHSKARMTYNEVEMILSGNKQLRTKYEALLPVISDLHEMYLALSKQRRQRGAIDFDTLESQIIFDAGGKIKQIIPRERNVAHKIIEESMLCANVSAAKLILRNKRETLFRVHDTPPLEKLRGLREFLAELGLELKGRDKPSAKDFAELIYQVQNREDKHVIETVMLRSLSQAEYTPENIGHFGLAYPGYCHFTSPIRRYPDLVTHRVILDILANRPSKKYHSKENLTKLGMLFSQTERRSDDATRDAELALKCHYMQDKVGDTFPGIVSSVTNFGLFVELKDIYIEGLIHITSLGDEYFHYEPVHHRLIGEHTKTVFRLGDPITVIVARVDLESRKIDFEPVWHGKKQKKKRTRHVII